MRWREASSMFRKYAPAPEVSPFEEPIFASLQALLAAGATVEDLTLTAEQAQAYYAAVAA
jgi:hypothetical protein